jgi:hypothetical protein
MPICKSWSAVGSNWKDIENIDPNRSRDIGSSHEQPIGRLIVVLVHYLFVQSRFLAFEFDVWRP